VRLSDLASALERVLAGGERKPGPVQPGADGGRPAVIDSSVWQVAHELPGGTGGSLLPELIASYLADDQARLETIARLLAEQRREAAADAAHALGGNAISFGGVGVRKAALDLEIATRSGDWPAAAARLTMLRHACAQLREELARRTGDVTT
jgi:HPt (histidine-containing phosphotransfer) domain-containing protein